jgi:hypothetical protein
VRPYGEAKDSAFDWLGLGGRKAKSPATPSKPSGGWRVGPDNIAGGINITRLGNLEFEDKSSREGLQENKTFQIFKLIILQILSTLEVDRAILAKEMKFFYGGLHFDDFEKKDTDKLAEKILENVREKQSNKGAEQENEETKEKIILSKRIEEKDEEIEALVRNLVYFDKDFVGFFLPTIQLIHLFYSLIHRLNFLTRVKMML